MSNAAALVAQLAAAGTPPELLAAVAQELFTAEAERRILSDRRENERVRKAKSRDVTGCHVTERDETGQDVTPPLPSPAPSFPPDPQTNPTPAHPPTRSPRAREAGTHLPDDWKPSKLDREAVSGQIVERRGQEWARRTLESFKNHWRSANGPNARKRDWQAAFQKWVIEQDNRDGRQQTNGMGRHQPAGEARILAAGRAFVSRGVGSAAQ